MERGAIDAISGPVQTQVQWATWGWPFRDSAPVGALPRPANRKPPRGGGFAGWAGEC